MSKTTECNFRVIKVLHGRGNTTGYIVLGCLFVIAFMWVVNRVFSDASNYRDIL